MDPKIAVLYHGPVCADGFGAAYAAWTVLRSAADYIPVNYGDPMPDLSKYVQLYIVDFSFPRETMVELMYDFDVVCLDHHKTAQEALKELEVPKGSKILFDMTKSGAVLTWEHFHPNEPIPLLLHYVQDRDLWAWKLISTKAVLAYLGIVERSFEAWEVIRCFLENPPDHSAIVQKGQSILKYEDMLVKRLAKNAKLEWIDGHHVPVVNSSILQSEIGNYLCEKGALFAAVYYVDGDKEVYSLRSKDFDVSEIAKKFDGGGHKQAAGFTLTKVRSPIVA